MVLYLGSHYNTGPYIHFPHFGNSDLGKLPSWSRTLHLLTRHSCRGGTQLIGDLRPQTLYSKPKTLNRGLGFGHFIFHYSNTALILSQWVPISPRACNPPWPGEEIGWRHTPQRREPISFQKRFEQGLGKGNHCNPLP